MEMRLDASQEFWQFDANAARPQSDNRVFQQDYLPTHIEPNMIENGFHGAIAQPSWPSMSENDWLVSLKSKSPFVVAATGWVDLTADDVESQMTKHQGDLSGLRWWLKETASQNDYSALAQGIQSLSNSDFSLDITLANVDDDGALTLLKQCSDQRCVIDLSAILSADPSIEQWQSLTKALAAQGNHYFRLTGLAEKVPAPDYEDQLLDVERVTPYIDIMLENLGSDRLIYASGWPHCMLAATYDEVYDITVALIEHLSRDEQAGIMGVNAARCYKIS